MQLPSDIALRWVTFQPGEATRREALLAPEEQARLQAFRAKRRREFVLGRVAARTLLAERLQVAPAEVPLRVMEGGAVTVAGTPLHLSIAHSGPHAVAAVGQVPLGVDLERIAARRTDLHRYILHPDEYHLLDTLPLDRPRVHILCWTLKEAVLKGVQTGLRLSPKKLRLEIALAEQSARVNVEGGEVWQVRFEEREGYYLTVAFPVADEA